MHDSDLSKYELCMQSLDASESLDAMLQSLDASESLDDMLQSLDASVSLDAMLQSLDVSASLEFLMEVESVINLQIFRLSHLARLGCSDFAHGVSS